MWSEGLKEGAADHIVNSARTVAKASAGPHAPKMRRWTMAFIVGTLNRWITRVLETWTEVRGYRAEGQTPRFFDLLGGSSIDPEVKDRLVADYLANRPLSIHASQLQSPW